MASCAEAKANIFYYGVRYIAEPMLSLLQKQPKQDQVFQNPDKEAEKLAEQIQNNINGANFGAARRLNRCLKRIVPQLSGTDRDFYEATTYEKDGWIDGYETGFTNSLYNFQNARRIIETKIRSNFRDKKTQELYWTTIHFEARARTGLASQGINRAENLRFARDGFNTGKDRFLQLEQSGDSRPDNIAFQDGWLAIVSMMEGKFKEAHSSATAMRERFRQSLQPDQESAGTAHAYLVEGLIFTEEGNFDEARKQFFKAEEIRRVVAPDRLRRGFALAGIARTFYREGACLRAAKYGLNAAISHPVSILYGLNSHLAA